MGMQALSFSPQAPYIMGRRHALEILNPHHYYYFPTYPPTYQPTYLLTTTTYYCNLPQLRQLLPTATNNSYDTSLAILAQS